MVRRAGAGTAPSQSSDSLQAKSSYFASSDGSYGFNSESSQQATRGKKHDPGPAHFNAQALLKSVYFDFAIAFVIVLNAVFIGVEQTLELGGHDLTAVQVAENIFLGIYILEILLRVYAYGYVVLRDNWVKFDLFMVIVGVTMSWIVEPILSASQTDDDAANQVGFVMVLRTARLLRLAKTARIFARIEELWALVRAFLGSFKLMCYSFCILFMLMYVFGAVGVELITKHPLATGERPDGVFQETVSIYFPNLPMTMLTLVHFACLDNMSDVWLPLIERDWSLSLYFVGVVLIMGIIIMNIIASVIHMSTQEQTIQEKDQVKQDQEHKLTSVIRELKKVFTRIDADGSGTLSRDEVMNISKADQAYLAKALRVSSCRELYNALDVEGSGVVTINDFFDGLWDAAALQKDLKMQRMEKQVEMMHWRIKETLDCQIDLTRKVERITSEVETLADGFQRDRLESITQSYAASVAEPITPGREPFTARSSARASARRRTDRRTTAGFSAVPRSLMDSDGSRNGSRSDSKDSSRVQTARRRPSVSSAGTKSKFRNIVENTAKSVEATFPPSGEDFVFRPGDPRSNPETPKGPPPAVKGVLKRPERIEVPKKDAPKKKPMADAQTQISRQPSREPPEVVPSQPREEHVTSGFVRQISPMLVPEIVNHGPSGPFSRQTSPAAPQELARQSSKDTKESRMKTTTSTGPGPFSRQTSPAGAEEFGRQNSTGSRRRASSKQSGKGPQNLIAQAAAKIQASSEVHASTTPRQTTVGSDKETRMTSRMVSM